MKKYDTIQVKNIQNRTAVGRIKTSVVIVGKTGKTPTLKATARIYKEKKDEELEIGKLSTSRVIS
jgi:hypothetical protein